MKLLFIIPDVSTAGGVEKTVAMLTRHLIDCYQHQITVLNAEPLGRNMFYEFHPQISFQSLNLPQYPSRALEKIKWYKQLKDEITFYLSQNDYDFVFAQGVYISACLNFIKTDAIKIGCAHTSYDAVHFLIRFLTRFLYKKLDAFVVLTDNDKNWYQKKLSNVFAIPNFVKQLPNEISNQRNNLVIAAGRLAQQKGFDLLIAAFKEVNRHYPHWKLAIYGEGKERPFLELQIKNHRLNDVISLPGQTLELDAKLKNAAIFVLSSRYEGFPLILLEAMSVGLCCISFDITGAGTVLDHNNNGLLVSQGKIDALAGTICGAISDVELREQLGKAARKTAQKYQITAVGSQWQQLIEQLIKKR